MSRIILSIEIAHYLSLDDLISIARITNTPDLDDFKALCRVSNGDLFKYFSYKVRTKKTYVSYAINESIQGKTLFRYVPKPYKDQLWNEIISNGDLSEYENGLDAVLKSKENVPSRFEHLMCSDDFAYVALRVNGCRLKQLNDNKRKRILVETAVLENGNALMYAPEELKDDTSLVSLCVYKFPYALEYAGAFCRSCKNIINIATSNVKWVRRYALG
tara:strand:+ start:22662 stop:23312 length:651 start_codon:yes stop_codon:yes gene_type:complete